MTGDSSAFPAEWADVVRMRALARLVLLLPMVAALAVLATVTVGLLAGAAAAWLGALWYVSP